MKRFQTLVGVYNADGGIIGQLTYVFKKVTGQTKCSFCALTHGAVSEKEIWGKFAKRTNFKYVHANEQNQISQKLAQFTSNRLPCVVGIQEGQFEMVYTGQQLEKFDGDTEAFIKSIREKVDFY